MTTPIYSLQRDMQGNNRRFFLPSKYLACDDNVGAAIFGKITLRLQRLLFGTVLHVYVEHDKHNLNKLRCCLPDEWTTKKRNCISSFDGSLLYCNLITGMTREHVQTTFNSILREFVCRQSMQQSQKLVIQK